MAVFEQQLLGTGARLGQRRLETARQRRAQFELATVMALRERIQIGDDRREHTAYQLR